MSSKDPEKKEKKERKKEGEREREREDSVCLFVRVFFGSNLGGGRGLGFDDHLQEGLAKFGYRPESKLIFFKGFFLCFGNMLDLLSKYGEFRIFPPS